MEDIKECDEQKLYQQYQELGGIINEQDYHSALTRAQELTTLDNKASIAQAELIAETSGIVLHNSEGALDPRIVLYGVLRADKNPGEQYHHSQMGDQQLFAEVLRMSGDKDSLQKLMKAYPNIFSPTKKDNS